MSCRRKLPDCDAPRLISHDTWPPTGFGVPSSSLVAYLKNDATSRKAAKPIPRTYASFDVKTTWYRSFGLKPPLTQICVGAGVPGNRLSALHFAHAQSVLATFALPMIFSSVLPP